MMFVVRKVRNLWCKLKFKTHNTADFRVEPSNNSIVFNRLFGGKKREMARVTGLEPATSGVTGRHSNQLSYTRAFPFLAT